jgi:cytochrome oxidase Cu insertion factor (SCO1/SenC/PrrC family)
VEFSRSAFRHGFDIIEIMHAIENAVVTVDLDPDSDPPKVLAVGADRSGRWVEVIWLRFAQVDVVIHAMKLRKVFEKFLEGERDE